MFSKFMITMMALAISATCFGVEEISKSKLIHNFIKDKIELSYHGEYAFVHGATNQLTDHNFLHIPTLGFKFAKDWKFTASAEFKYTDSDTPKYPNRFYRALYSISRENLLTEKEHGIKLDSGVARRVFDRRTMPGTFGNDRVFINLSRGIPGGIGKNTASLLAQYLFNDPKNLDANTWKHGVELIPAVNLVFTDKFTFSLQDDINYNSSYYTNNPKKYSIAHEAYSTFTYKKSDFVSPYFQFKYVHGDGYAATSTKANPAGTPLMSDTLLYYIGAGYSMTPKLSLTPEIGTEIFTSSDRKDLSDRFKYVDFTFYVDYSF